VIAPARIVIDVDEVMLAEAAEIFGTATTER